VTGNASDSHLKTLPMCVLLMFSFSIHQNGFIGAVGVVGMWSWGLQSQRECESSALASQKTSFIVSLESNGFSRSKKRL
jgi:hypothetical protein